MNPPRTSYTYMFQEMQDPDTRRKFCFLAHTDYAAEVEELACVFRCLCRDKSHYWWCSQNIDDDATFTGDLSNLYLIHDIISGIENSLLQGTICRTSIASAATIQGVSWPTTSTNRPRIGSKCFRRKFKNITAHVENVLVL